MKPLTSPAEMWKQQHQQPTHLGNTMKKVSRPQSAVMNKSFAQPIGNQRANQQSNQQITTSQHTTPASSSIQTKSTPSSRPKSAFNTRPQSGVSTISASSRNNHQFQPPYPSFASPYTPLQQISPFSSSSAFSGPYTYLPSTMSAHSNSQPAAHSDWTRIEKIKQNIAEMQEHVESIATVVAEQGQQSTKVPELLLRKYKSVETGWEKSIPENNNISQWRSVVDTALTRFGQSSDYLHTMTSTVSLLELWSLQLIRMCEIVTAAIDDELMEHQQYTEYKKVNREQLEREAQIDPGQKIMERLIQNWTFSTSRSDDNDSFSSCLPSFLTLLGRISELTSFLHWYNRHSDSHSRVLQQQHQTNEKLRQDLELMQEVMVVAGKQRSKQRSHQPETSFIRRRQLLDRNETYSPSRSPSGTRSPAAESETMLSTSSVSSRPLSAISVRSSTAFAQQTKYLDLSNRRQARLQSAGRYRMDTDEKVADEDDETIIVDNYSAATGETQTTMIEPIPANAQRTIEALEHQVQLLRASLQDANDAIAAKDKAQREPKSSLESAMHVEHSRLRDARSAAESQLSLFQQQFSTQQKAWELAYETRLQDELRKQRQKQQELEQALQEAKKQSDLRLQHEKNLRDKLERDRWDSHVAAMQEQQESWQSTLRELAAARKELDVLREISNSDRHQAHQAREALLKLQSIALEERNQQQKQEDNQREIVIEKEKKKSVKDAEEAEFLRKHDQQTEEQIMKLKRKIAKGVEELNQARAREELRAQELKTQTETLHNANKELERVKTLLLTAETKANELLQANEQVRSSSSSTKSSLQSELTILRAELSTSNVELDNARRQLMRSEQQAQSLADTIRLMKEQAESQQQQHEATKRELKLTQSSLQESHQLMAEFRADSEEKIRALETQCATLSGQLSVAESQSAELQSQLSTALTIPSPRSSRPVSALRSRPTSAVPNLHQQKIDAAEKRIKEEMERLEDELLSLRLDRKIFDQHRQDLDAEKTLLSTAASLLHDRLLSQLSVVLPLRTSPLPVSDSTSLLTPATLSSLIDQLRQQSLTTKTLHIEVEQSMQPKAWAERTKTLQERLDEIAKQCEKHEQILKEGIAK